MCFAESSTKMVFENENPKFKSDFIYVFAVILVQCSRVYTSKIYGVKPTASTIASAY